MYCTCLYLHKVFSCFELLVNCSIEYTCMYVNVSTFPHIDDIQIQVHGIMFHTCQPPDVMERSWEEGDPLKVTLT